MLVRCKRLASLPEDRGAPPVVLLRIIADADKMPIDIESLQAWYDLSPREAAVAAAFAEGLSLTEYAEATDVAINLRWPTLGETSGTLTRLMGAGKPVLVTGRCQFNEYPEEGCWKIPPGELEAERIAQAIVALARYPKHRRSMGHFARDYISHFTWDKVTKRFREFVDEVYG